MATRVPRPHGHRCHAGPASDWHRARSTDHCDAVPSGCGRAGDRGSPPAGSDDASESTASTPGSRASSSRAGRTGRCSLAAVPVLSLRWLAAKLWAAHEQIQREWRRFDRGRHRGAGAARRGAGHHRRGLGAGLASVLAVRLCRPGEPATCAGSRRSLAGLVIGVRRAAVDPRRVPASAVDRRDRWPRRGRRPACSAARSLAASERSGTAIAAGLAGTLAACRSRPVTATRCSATCMTSVRRGRHRPIRIVHASKLVRTAYADFAWSCRRLARRAGSPFWLPAPRSGVAALVPGCTSSAGALGRAACCWSPSWPTPTSAAPTCWTR